LLGVVAVVGTIALLTRSDTPPATDPSPTTQQEPSFTLTNAEAVARFKELNELRMQAYINRDVTLISTTYTSDSKVRATVSREIRRLLEAKVIDESVEETLRAEVVSNTAAEIRIREVARIKPRFVNRQGRAVTSDSTQIVETRIWTLHMENGKWLVFDALVTSAHKADV
jgi:hypothetical protein